MARDDRTLEGRDSARADVLPEPSIADTRVGSRRRRLVARG